MVKSDKYLENFTLTPIFALHSKNGIGLPDGVTVAQLFLVQFVLVRIQVRQPKKEEAAPIIRGGFFICENEWIKLAWSQECV